MVRSRHGLTSAADGCSVVRRHITHPELQWTNCGSIQSLQGNGDSTMKTFLTSGLTATLITCVSAAFATDYIISSCNDCVTSTSHCASACQAASGTLPPECASQTSETTYSGIQTVGREVRWCKSTTYDLDCRTLVSAGLKRCGDTEYFRFPDCLLRVCSVEMKVKPCLDSEPSELGGCEQ
jgi:hypothetical protein